MRKRGEEKKGKGSEEKDRQHCKVYIFCEGNTEEIYLKHFERSDYNAEIIPVDTAILMRKELCYLQKNILVKGMWGLD